MRLWSISPSYLDRQGLLAVWREGLLAQQVLLQGEYTYKCNICKCQRFKKPKAHGCGNKDSDWQKYITSYYNHPQLKRFKDTERPLRVIGQYLTEIYNEAKKRDYNFNSNLIKQFMRIPIEQISVTTGQIKYEFGHLMNKLQTRDREFYNLHLINICQNDTEFFNKEGIKLIEHHPLFKVIEGEVESWEKITS